MKKITLVFLWLSSFAFLFEIHAQSFQVFYKNSTVNISGQVIHVNASINGDNIQTVACDTISVKNISANSIKTRCSRSVVSAVAGSINSFCWGTGCYSATTSVSPLLQSPDIGPSVTNTTFIGDYKPQLNSGATTIKYLFYNNATPSDSVSVTIIYDLSPMGIDELSKPGGTISAAYPNPASAFVSFKYNMNEVSQKGKIIFHDYLGKSVKEISLTDKQGLSKINVSELIEGVYFYTFLVDDVAIVTKKLVIGHQ